MYKIEECVVIEGNTARVRVRRPYGEPDEWMTCELDSVLPELPLEPVLDEPDARYLFSYVINLGWRQVVFNVTGVYEGFGPHRETVHGPYLLRQAPKPSMVTTIYRQRTNGAYRLQALPRGRKGETHDRLGS